MAKRRISRRQFVATVTAGAGTVLLGRAANALPLATSRGAADPFQIVELGRSGIKTTLLGMGTGFSGFNRSSQITRDGVAESLIRQAYEKGIRFFDCADAYGTHPATMAALKSIPREKYVIGTKIWLSPTGGIPESERPDANIVIDRFRKELNTDYLDLVQIHLMTDPKWTDTYKKQMDILENLKAKKIIRAHGVSVHSLEAMEACVGNPWIDVIHVRINPFGDSMDKKDPELVTPVIEKLHNEGKGVIGMKLIGNGKYKNDSAKIDETINYVLNLGTVDMFIVGFEKPEQIDDYATRLRRAFAVKPE